VRPDRRQIHLFALAAVLVPLGGDPGWTTVPVPKRSDGWQLARPTPTPTPAPPPAAPAPAATAAPTTTTAAVSKHPRPAKRKRPRRSKPHVTRQPPHAVEPRRTGAVLAADATTSKPAFVSTLLVAALGFAIACFAFGAAPAGQIRWRRGAAFVAYQRLNITTAGVLSLLVAAIVFALTRN
jgi:hypothetical protein